VPLFSENLEEDTKGFGRLFFALEKNLSRCSLFIPLFEFVIKMSI